MRPIMRNPPLCEFNQLKDGTYSINDLADFHEAMDEEAEYVQRFAEANKRT